MAYGFFKKEEIHTHRKPKKTTSCVSCGLYRQCHSPKMPVSGKGYKGIFIISETPSKREDEKGQVLIGLPGHLLKKTLKDNGIDLQRDCWKMHAVSCKPKKTVTGFQIDCCRKRVLHQIDNLQPKLIIILGGVGIKSFLGHRWPEEPGGITKWRGWVIPDRQVRCWVAPTFHPSYVLYKDKEPVVEVVFRQDIERAIQHLSKPFPAFVDDTKYVHVLTQPKAIKERLRLILKHGCKLLSFDYETTGLKPQAKGHDIVSCSAAVSSTESYAWPMNNPVVRQLWVSILQAEQIKKAAHNAKFEDRWSRAILNTPVHGWVWCSLLMAHQLDNRPKIANLKFQTYVNYGVIDYSSHISPYLKGVDPKNGNSLNRIHELNVEDMLVYNGLDSLYEHWLVLDQMKALGVTDYV